MHAQHVEMKTSLGVLLTLEDLQSPVRKFMSSICPELWQDNGSNPIFP